MSNFKYEEGQKVYYLAYEGYLIVKSSNIANRITGITFNNTACTEANYYNCYDLVNGEYLFEEDIAASIEELAEKISKKIIQSQQEPIPLQKEEEETIIQID